MRNKKIVRILVMGVSGCGKSSLGHALSSHYGVDFIEADDYHPAANVAKMSSGHALDDQDRKPWLEALNQKWKSEEGAVLACSALKRSYRELLFLDLSKRPIILYLKGDFDLIYERMQRRNDHFMPVSLLRSQFETLQVPEEAIVLDISHSIETLLSLAINKINQQINFN